VRGGYGLFWDVVGIDRNHAIQNGFSQRTNVIPTTDNGFTFQATIANPFPNGLVRPAAVGPKTYIGRAITFFPLNWPSGYMQRWSFSISRELPGRSLIEASYVGNRGTRLPTSKQVDTTPRQYLSTSTERDQALITYMTANVANPFNGIPEFAGGGITGQTVSRANLLRPYPQYNGMTTTYTNGFSWYHSLQARFEKRFSHGISFNTNYTWSKWMEASAYLNDSDDMPTHVISANDRPHRVVVSWIYELPFGKGRPFMSKAPGILQAIAGGWQFQAIWQGQTGPPLGFGNIIFRGDLHDLVLPSDQRIPERWFNIDAGFEKASAKQLASNVRAFPLRLTGLRGDGEDYWNASLRKEFALRERAKLQIRTEWEGAFNHPTFDTPNMAPTNTLFGQVSSVRGEGRRVFAAAKLIF
jgi:hypothetical protein